MKALKSMHYSTLIALCVVLLIVLLASKTQSRSEQRMHQIEFEACVDSMYTDTVCDSCYTIVMHDKHWFNKELYHELWESKYNEE
jgi:hypothetical protein